MENRNRTQLGNFVCAVMLLVVLVTQFLPFWKCTAACKDHKETEKMVSIAEYVWLPEHHRPITKGMTDVYLDAYGQDYVDEDGKKYTFAVDDIVLPLVVIFLGSIAGTAMCVVFSHELAVPVLPLLIGSIGIYWYLSNPAMQAGYIWGLHLMVLILTVLTSLSILIYNIVNQVKTQKR